MADEYYARYAGLSHHDLYYQLRAGDPGQVENLASAWRSLAVSVDELAADLDRDLDGLRSSWTGSASDEFDHRVRLVSGFARELSEEFTRTQRSLSLMAGPLRGAQARAEHPDETDDHDKLLRGIAIGAVAGPGGALVGGLFGHQLDKEEKQRAHQRMIRLVAELASEYDLAVAPIEAPVTATPSELPGSSGGDQVDLAAGPRAGSPGGAPVPAGAGGSGTGVAAPSSGIGTAPGFAAAGAPVAGSGAATVPAGEGAGGGTSLAGAASLGAWSLGAAGLVGAAGNASRPGTVPAQGPTAQTAGALGSVGGGYTGGRQPGHLPVPGSRPGTITGVGTATGGTAGSSKGANPASARGGAGHPAPAGPAGKGAAGQGGRTAGTAAGHAAGTGRRADEREGDGRPTWLTEDEIVWQRGDAPEPLVGDGG